MRKKIEALLDKFQGNAYPAMVDDLSGHLGVSSDSLRALGLGWAPIVEFSKGPLCFGWWVIPERLSNGRTVGLGLRTQDDRKLMYPGSKHGLIYELNPDHSEGNAGYTAGPHNWVRLTDANLECPVCHKPDGCLLDAVSPHDPRAVICIRVKSTRPVGFGFLHVLRSGKSTASTSALIDNGGPIVVVEGMTDTAAARDLGFTAVGRPSNLACLDELGDLLRSNRPIWIIGENDKKSDNREPGREGMLAAFHAARKGCRDVLMCMPPIEFKDLRAWKNRAELDKEMFSNYVLEHGEREAESLLIEDDRPLTVARSYVRNEAWLAGRPTLRRWRNNWYQYVNGRYRVNGDGEELNDSVYRWAHARMVEIEKPDGSKKLEKVRANQSFVMNTLAAMQSEVRVPSEELMPCWINGANGYDATELVVFSNGILRLPLYFQGADDALGELTPDLFSTTALSYEFDPVARCPDWLDFLRRSLGDDPGKIDLLQEWFGYCLVPDRSMQKMLFMRGPTAAGKGVVIRTLELLVGDEQKASATFSSLAGPFGLQPLLGKLICTMPDVRIAQYAEAMRGLEVLLALTGDDSVSVNRKNKDFIDSVHLNARIVMASNGFLDIPDHASAMLRRVLLLDYKHSFKDHPDTTLGVKIKEELPGIAIWALEGLRRLREKGTFTQPPSSIESEREWRVSTNPLAAFIEECCIMDETVVISKEELYDSWTRWSTERRFRPTTQSQFYERIRFAVSNVVVDSIDGKGCYRGLDLKPWARRKLLGG